MDVARPLPIRLPLLDDELLSSWLIRTALVHGCDPVTLTDLIWPGWRCWTQDVDRTLTADRCLTLSRVSGLSPETIDAATVSSLARSVSTSPLNARATWPWMLALGSRNVRRRGGLQYCPLCFRDDVVPYLKVNARLAWHTGCAAHGVLLIDRCHACGASLEPHRTVGLGGTFVHCARCRADLREAPNTVVPAGALAFQAAADQVIRDGSGHAGGVSLPSAQWFDACRYSLLILRRAARGRSRTLSDWLEACGTDLHLVPSPATGLALELLPVTERAPLLAALSGLISTEPTRALAEAQRLGVRAGTLRLRAQNVPDVIEEMMRHLPGTRVTRNRRVRFVQGPRSREAVLRKFARLKRKYS